MHIAARILLLAGLTGAAFGQGVPAPFIRQQYFSANGQPLGSGTLCTFASGTSTPVATFNSYLLSNANPVCVPLDASGRASIWLDPAIVYRFILKDSTGVTIWTEDGISVAAAGGAGGQTWATSGSTIYNPTAGSKVCIGQTGACTTALALLNVQGTSSGNNYLVRIDDAAGSPGINLFANGNSVGSYAGDSAGLRLRAGDGTSQMTVAAGAVSIQNVGGGATSLLIKGGTAQGSSNFLTVQNNAGSTLAYIDSAGRYLGTLYNAAPATGADIAYQTANSNFSVNGFGDITSNGSINATGADGADPYKVNGVTMVDAAGNATFTTLTCTSSPCGSGGGGGGSPVGVTNSIQIKASGTAFGGDANFVYNPGTGIVQLLGAGYLTSHGGLLSDGTAPNIIQAPNGGVAGKWLTTTESLFFVQVAVPAAPAAGQSKFYMDSTSHKVLMSQNGGAFANLATNAGALTNGNCVSIDGSGNFVDAGGPCTTGGGGGTVSSSAQNNIGYYTTAGTGTTIGGSTHFTWNNGTQQLALASTSTAVAAITVTSGYIASDGGFVTTSAATNAIQAPNGQIAGKTLFASDSLLFSEEAAPALSGAGQSRIYMNSSSHSLLVSVNGSTYVPFGSGGGGVSSITGTTNQVNVNTPTGAVILSLPQNIDTGAGVNFGTVNATGVVQSGATGTSLAFKTANNLFSLDGSGNVSSAGQVNLSGGGAANQYKINGITVIDSGRNATVQNLTVSGTCTGCGASGGGVTSAAGTSNQVLVNGGVGAATGAVTFSLPQSISTASSPTFSGLTINGATTFSGNMAPASNAVYSIGDATHQLFGVNASFVNAYSGGFTVNGSAVINSSRQFVGAGVDVGGSGISAGGYNVNGGFIGQTFNVNIPGMSISGTSCTNGLIFKSGILVSCFDLFGGARGLFGLWLIGLLIVFKTRAPKFFGGRCRRHLLG